MLTPRARLVLHPAVVDPRGIVEASGRMGCSLSLRALAAGIVEFMFPSSGLLHQGDPLFRLYDPGIIPDLAAAEKALSDYDVNPLLIAPPPIRRSAPRGLVPGLQPVQAPPGFFPSPTMSGNRVPQMAQPKAERPRIAALRPPPTAPAPRAELKSAPRRTARLQSLPEPPDTDLGPYEDALSDAKQAFSDAQDRVAACEEDYAAKKELVELGALARKAQDASAEKLAEARSDLSTAEARVGVARERLSDEKARGEKAQAAYRTAKAEAEQAQDETPEVEVIRGSRSSGGSGVEVIRGGGTEVRPNRSADSGRLASRSSRKAAGSSPRPGAMSFLRRPPAPSEDSGLEYRGGSPLVSARFPQAPEELDRLADQRWTDYQAPSDGVALQQTVPNGSQVQAGQEVLRVVNTQWAQTVLRVSRQDVERFEPGTVVTLTFDGYPDVVFQGWINSLKPEQGGETARAELVVFCRSGYYGTDAFATLQWLALATPLEEHTESPAPVVATATPSEGSDYEGSADAHVSLVPRNVWELSHKDDEPERSERMFEGQLQLVEFCGTDQACDTGSAERQRLAKLMKWRDGFVDGMTRALFSDNVVLTYPKSGEIRQAVERMATGRVSHEPDRCARTMREALGWGLGDAHVWAQDLPGRGYVARQDGLARPGDILVWPFTFPPRGSQHIGIAVQQNGRLMLLSNLSGRLGTSDVAPGYVAFYNPRGG